MNGPLTTRELMDAVKDITPHIADLEDKHRVARAAHLTAQNDYEDAEALAFIEAKEQKVSDETAKRIARIKSSHLKRKADELKAEFSSAKVGSDSWQRVLDFYAALSHTLNRELKNETQGVRS